MQILMQVLQWMEDAGIHPSIEMYHDISSFSQKCCGDENAAVIKQRLGMNIHVVFRIVFPHVSYACDFIIFSAEVYII